MIRKSTGSTPTFKHGRSRTFQLALLQLISTRFYVSATTTNNQ